MPKLFLYNTLSRKKEEFQPSKGEVGLYTCGPTVYNYAHLGNLRTYLFEDFLKRTLEYNGYPVKHVMNITDVGHLTGDMDMGEDKIETGAQREGKTAWQIAEFYTVAFQKDLERLNIAPPTLWCRATDNIPEQINLIKTLEEKDLTYKTTDGIYFNTAKIKDYNKLSHLPLEQLKEGARVEKNPEKQNPTDFALWKFSPPGAKRQMEWASPWGTGFPGWHIECSAMSLKYLSGILDIHCGGIDHINIHHTNEIAQSEAATSQAFFKYWLHGAFLNISGGKRMGKSAGNFLTLDEAILAQNINPLAYRFATLQVHYRKPMEYSETTLPQAEQGLNSLLTQVASLGSQPGRVIENYRQKFLAAINDDLNMPQGLAVLAMTLKAKEEPADKLATILDFDKVLGLKLNQAIGKAAGLDIQDLPLEIQGLVKVREVARQNKAWGEADKLREKILQSGYAVEDTPDGQKITQK